jgi:hypothetical protein
MIQATTIRELEEMHARAEGPRPPLNNGQLLAELEDVLHTDGEQKRAILTDMLWKVVRQDYHGVMDCAADLRELGL